MTKLLYIILQDLKKGVDSDLGKVIAGVFAIPVVIMAFLYIPLDSETTVIPMDGVYTSPYGMRTHPITGVYSMHRGVDIAGEHNAPVRAIFDGEVYKVVTTDNGLGNHVIIQHELEDGETIYSLYAHLSQVLTFEGLPVFQGTIIGLEGGEPGVDDNVGYSTGHHLHIEVWTSYGYDRDTDPVPYITRAQNLYIANNQTTETQ